MEKKTPTHGRTFTGVVTSDRMTRTVTVMWERRHYVPKYQRYERRFSKVKAHNPDDIDAKKGDVVTIMETRPLSKTKHFIIIKKHGARTDDGTVSAPTAPPEKKVTKKTPAKAPGKKAPVKRQRKKAA